MNNRMGCECSEASHDERVLALDVDTRRSIEHAAAHDLCSVVAQVGMAIGARWTLTAHGDERVDDVIAGNYSADIGANSFDNAGTFVTSNPRVTTVGHITGDEVLIGVTQTRCNVAHQHLCALGLINLDIFKRPCGVLRTPQHCCACFHAYSLV